MSRCAIETILLELLFLCTFSSSILGTGTCSSPVPCFLRLGFFVSSLSNLLIDMKEFLGLRRESRLECLDFLDFFDFLDFCEDLDLDFDFADTLLPPLSDND